MQQYARAVRTWQGTLWRDCFGASVSHTTRARRGLVDTRARRGLVGRRRPSRRGNVGLMAAVAIRRPHGKAPQRLDCYGLVAMALSHAAEGLGLVLALAGALPGCSDPPVGSPSPTAVVEAELVASCTALDASSCAEPSPSFATDIQPMLDRACNKSCHNFGNAQALWPLEGYQDVRDWANLIARDVKGCSMPPLDGGVPMSAGDRAKLLDWIECGAKNN
jgi:hypothetical protein